LAARSRARGRSRAGAERDARFDRVFFDAFDGGEKHIAAGRRFRLGGLVQPGSLVHGDNLAVTFEVADGSAALPVSYKGILPDLFREGQGVVAEGVLDPSGVFRPTRCSPSTTRTTCRRKWRTR